jgi:hypothetical protein
MSATLSFALGVVLAVFLIGPIIAARPQLRVAVPGSLDVQVDNSAVLTAALVRKGWGFGGFTYIGGTIKLQNYSSPHFSVSPTSATTSAASPYADFTVFGLSVGTGLIQVTGSSSYGSHAGFFSSGPWVTVNVRQ